MSFNFMDITDTAVTSMSIKMTRQPMTIYKKKKHNIKTEQATKLTCK